MKTAFQKTLVAASVGAAMLAAVGTASANSLLFPFFTTASGAQSALSISAGDVPNIAAAGETLHYVYNYGPACIHFDGTGKVTPNDLLQHSIASPGAGGYGKAVGSDTTSLLPRPKEKAPQAELFRQLRRWPCPSAKTGPGPREQGQFC